jgi:beta-RFAP synthase
MVAFEGGGFIIDGGRKANDRAPPVLVHSKFPEAWRALLILDPAAQGVHGDRELQAFAALPSFPAATAAHICHLVLMRLLPALGEADIDAFGSGLAEIQEIVGGHFASAQGGSPWSSPAVGRMARRLAAVGAVGIGQSSWGPTGFAFVSSEAEAMRLYHSSVGDATREGLEMRIVRGRNIGARISRL